MRVNEVQIIRVGQYSNKHIIDPSKVYTFAKFTVSSGSDFIIDFIF